MNALQRDLIEDHIGLAVYVAIATYRRLRRPGYNRDDALSVANEAITLAALKFPGGNFRAWLAKTVRQAVRNEARKWGRDVQGVPAGTVAPAAAEPDPDGSIAEALARQRSTRRLPLAS